MQNWSKQEDVILKEEILKANSISKGAKNASKKLKSRSEGACYSRANKPKYRTSIGIVQDMRRSKSDNAYLPSNEIVNKTIEYNERVNFREEIVISLMNKLTPSQRVNVIKEVF
jgi:hypothetical protein